MGGDRELSLPKDSNDSERINSAGQATVELALVLPVIVFFLLLIIHVGIIVRQHMLVTHASREAARVLSVDNSRKDAIEVAKKNLPNAKVEIFRPLTSGEYLNVTVRDNVKSPIPILGRVIPEVTLSSTFEMRVEK